MVPCHLRAMNLLHKIGLAKKSELDRALQRVAELESEIYLKTLKHQELIDQHAMTKRGVAVLAAAVQRLHPTPRSRMR